MEYEPETQRRVAGDLTHLLRDQLIAPKKRSFEENLALVRARGKTVTPRAVPAGQRALPHWPEEVRGVPNAALRGALFTVSKERAMHKQLTAVAALSGIAIRVQNARLNQQDLDLFEMLLHLQREQPLGEKVEFTAHAMLKALGRPMGGSAHERLANDLARLMGSIVEIKWIKERKTFLGALVERAFRDDVTGRYVVRLNSDTMKLYGQGHTWIDSQQRQALGQNNLAKWLHGFYASHAQPFPYKVKTLRGLCGTTIGRLVDFRRVLRLALGRLKEVGSINNWDIDVRTDLVTVVKMPTQTQRKYLAKIKSMK